MAKKETQPKANQEQKKQGTKALATTSERFVATIQRQFTAEIGDPMAFTTYEKTLAQHLFLKIDTALKELEAKRRDPKRLPITWENVNMQKLALDAVHRVNLGLDALISAHIYPIPYYNDRNGKYDLDLRVGYVGKDYYRRENAVEKPVNVIYELVYSTDKFKPIKKSLSNEVESYELEITQPFDRGKIIGGFGYIIYEDPRKNKLIIVTEADFIKSRNHAKNNEFWDNHPVEMRYKTLVNRVTDKLPLDPKSVNAASYAYVEAQENEDVEKRAEQEIQDNANKDVIDIPEGSYTVTDDEASMPKEQSKPSGNQASTAKSKGDKGQASMDAGYIDDPHVMAGTPPY